MRCKIHKQYNHSTSQCKIVKHRRSCNSSSRPRFQSQRNYDLRVSFKDGFCKSKRHLKDSPEISNVSFQNIDKQLDDFEYAIESVPVACKSNTLNAHTTIQLLSCINKYGMSLI